MKEPLRYNPRKHIIMEEENVGYEPLLTQTNALGGTFMAIGLILCVIGFMLTVVVFMLHKGGKLGNFNPWKMLVPVWAVVSIASIPGLVHFGSTLFPKPPISQAESAVAAYEQGTKGLGIVGSENRAMRLIIEEDRDQGPPTTKFKELMYKKTDSGEMDSCTKVKLIYMRNDLFLGPQEFAFYAIPVDYSEEKCGGPVQEWTE